MRKAKLSMPRLTFFALGSLQDNLPNTGVKAWAGGMPLVGIATGGLPNLVADREMSALAYPPHPAALDARPAPMPRPALPRHALARPMRTLISQ